MLAREAFREMLFPLSEKELHYREHPEDSLIYFKNFRYEGEATVVTGADNSDEILFFPSPKKTGGLQSAWCDLPKNCASRAGGRQSGL